MESQKPTIDKRTMDRYLSKGILKDSEIKEHFKSLPDSEANAQWVHMDMHEADLSDEVEGDLVDDNEDDFQDEDDSSDSAE